MNERVCALHATNVIMVQLEGNHSIKVNFVPIARRERITAAKETQDLLLLLLPGEL